ncbi:type IV toxin-antitoxin system AbiEi family antitoxin domain-containing protein [Haloechinothrix halophila]|uniref:type IV toxin-antitoxin system AbiEi family antitoxin domain-containing protein n=1 Tax=Haloechinothrix halophila TaxID=1069073 RepID=UPI000405961B|nr:type IV toxin-antitoxin system AbiEi family antitoxin domain-containing protein [Haloechinothrix halophila]
MHDHSAVSAVFTRAHARAAGHSDADIRRLLRRGEWIPLRRGVYATASALASSAGDDEREHALAAFGTLLALDRDAVAAGTSAARILGLPLLGRAPTDIVLAIESASGHRDDYVLRTTALPPQHRVRCHGVPITSAARTVVDLARECGFAHGVVAADAALHSGLASQGELIQVLRDCRGWPGIDGARRAVTFADAACESVLESVSRIAIHQQGLPMPRTQVTLGDAAGPIGRADFLWEHARVVGEADGLAKYLGPADKGVSPATPDRWTMREHLRAEKRREERLADLGYEIIRWGWEDATNPRRLAYRLCAALDRGLERQRGRLAS